MSRLEPRRRFQLGGGNDDMESPYVDAPATPPVDRAQGILPPAPAVPAAPKVIQPKPKMMDTMKPWQRAMIAGGLGAGMGGSSGIGALGAGLGAAGLSLLINRKKKRTAMDEKPTPDDAPEPVVTTGPTQRVRRGGAIGRRPKMARAPKTRFQTGGVAPAALGAAVPRLPGTPAVGGGIPGALTAPGGAPGLPPAALGGPPAPPMAPPALPAAPPPPVPPPSAGVNPIMAAQVPTAATAPAAMPPGMAGPGAGVPLNALAQALPGTRPYAKGGKVKEGPVDDGSETPAKKLRPDRQWGNTGKGASNEPGIEKKAKGGKVLHKRPKGPKIAIAIKKPVSTPNPYDYEASEGTAPPPGPNPPAAAPPPPPPPGLNKGGSCDKMAAGGAAKVRKGFPNTNKPPKRLARGGTVRGCGAATKGCSFSGVF